MTNINCSSDCIYQSDGKCCFENVSPKIVTPNDSCAYYNSRKSYSRNK